MSNDKKSINKIDRGNYTILLSYNPCDLFTYFNVTEMHGLSIAECQNYNNTSKNAYIAGLSNFVPKESEEYNKNDKRFVFINLLRCTDSIKTFALIMHEMMHHSLWLHNYDMTKEEEIITWAEEQSYDIMEIIRHEKQ
jgi:hypothetical protein